MPQRSSFLACIMICLFVTTAWPDDWPMRGRTNDRNSVSLEAAPAFEFASSNKQSQKIMGKWSARLGTVSHGETAVSDGLVWVGTNNAHPRDAQKTNDASVLMCFRESTGEFLYQYLSPRLPHYLIDWPITSITSTPLIEKDRIWFCTNRGEVICLDIGKLKQSTGLPSVVWKVDLTKEYSVTLRGIMIGCHSQHCSVASYGDAIYVTTSNSQISKESTDITAPGLLCLSKSDGSLRWKVASAPSKVFGAHFGNPLVIEVDQAAQVIIGDADEWLRSFSAETGELIWEFNLNPNQPFQGRKRLHAKAQNRRSMVATPVAHDGRVYAAIGRDVELCQDPGALYCMDPRRKGDVSEFVLDDSGSKKANTNSAVIWSYRDEANSHDEDTMHCTLASPVIHEGLLVIPDSHGIIHCLDCKTGERQWTHVTDQGICASALVIDHRIYVGTLDGDLIVFKHQREKSLIGKLEVSENSIEVGPVFANGVLYVTSRSELKAISN